MTSFPLKIVTPDGLIYDGPAEKIIVRTNTGDMAVLARHINCVCPLGMGRAIVEIDGKRRAAACIGGMLSVTNGEVALVPTTFEWAEDIDYERADRAYQKAKAILDERKKSETELRMAEVKIKRALIRRSVAQEFNK